MSRRPSAPAALRRVAYVCTDPGIPVFGRKGASVHVQAVLRVLARQGLEVQLVCARTGGEPPADLKGVAVHLLPRVRADDLAARERSALESDRAVAAVLDALSVHAPLDLVYERYALWGRTATAWAAGHGVRSVLEVNAPLVDEQRTHRGLVDERTAEDVAAAALGTADAVVCVSDQVAGWARARSTDPARVVVVPNGVDTRRVVPADRPVGSGPGRFTVGFVGTLKPWHGVEVLLDALALLHAEDPSYRCLLVGDGPEAATLVARAERLGVADAVEATGAVSPQEVVTHLHRMDVATAPYPATEGFYFSPLKVYEYLAAGLPVVASDVGPLPGLLAGGRWGALVRPGDPRALADAVRGLRADPARRRRIRAEAPLTAAAHDWDHVVARILDRVGLHLSEATRVVA